MRRLTLPLVVLVASLGATSCNNTLLIKFGDMIYQVSCREQFAAGGGGCTALVHDINASDGENGAHVSCAVSTVSGVKSLSFDMSGSDMTGLPFRLSLSHVSYTAGGAATSGSLTMVEGSTTYSGRVGAAAPTTSFPCQVTGIMESLDTSPEMNQQIEGNILCEHLTPAAAPTQFREVEAPSPAAPMQPFHFRIVFCDGLTVH